MKLVLDNVALTDDFFTDTRLIGIIAPVKNYHFCWQLNNLLGYNFRLDTDIDKQLRKKKRQYLFSVYRHDETDFLRFYLFHNHCDGEYLLPEFRHLDFLWLIKDDIMQEEDVTALIGSIRTIPAVQLITEMTNEKIKNKQHLIF